MRSKQVMQIIPVLNCPDRACAVEKIAAAKKFLKKEDFLHIDVADGVFTFHKTWNDPAGWVALKSSFPLEVHLMVEHPKEWIAPWLAAGAKRFIVHVETIDEDSLRDIVAQCTAGHAELMLSSNPEIPAEDLTPYLHDISRFQVLCVNPGLAGQKFLPLALEKVKWLKYAIPDALIEVDGGITPETAKWAKDAGADIIVSASYIFGSKDPKKAYEELKKI
jgi:ribulose-phosphate 3-epimerase